MTGPAARLYLTTPPISDAASFASRLETALAGGGVACLRLALAQPLIAEGAKAVRGLAEIAQRHDVALLVDDDPRLALRANADGVHVTDPGVALQEALAALRPRKIVGAGNLRNRDAAMQAGEAGADYVMLGEPWADGKTQPFERTLDQARWWVDIFNVPCVAYARTLDDAAALAEAQCEFVAVDGMVWDHAAGPATAIAELAAIMRAHPLVDA